MFFKKKKLPSQKKKYNTPQIIFSFIGTFIVFGLCIFSVRAIDAMNLRVFDGVTMSGGLDTSKNSIFNPRNVVKKKDRENIYILLTGRGGGTHDAPELTDTIILAGINFREQTISMLSLPRDLWVEYPDSQRAGRLNSVYENALYLDKAIPINDLKDKVSQISGKQIDYYMNIDFEGFIKVVDLLGGVEVTLEENFVDNAYPNGPGRYKTFILRKGTWTLDGEVALMYARSRKSTSDFDRSLRQQQMLDALRSKVSELGYLSDAGTILELYEVFNTYVETDLSLPDLVSIGLDIRSWKETKTLSFNLNDTCFAGSFSCETGGFLYVPQRNLFYGASVLLPNGATANNLEVYDDIHTFADLIFDTPSFFNSNKEIIVYNASRIGGLASDFSNSVMPYGLTILPENLLNLRNEYSGTGAIYYNSLKENDPNLLFLEKFTNLDIVQKKGPIYSSGATIEVILADTSNY